MPERPTDAHGEDAVPTALLGDFTMVHDRARNRAVLRLSGQVILPLGAEVELGSPDVSATVIGVRLRTGSPTLPAHVCLEVDVPAEYWDDFATLGAAIERHMRATTPAQTDASAPSGARQCQSTQGVWSSSGHARRRGLLTTLRGRFWAQMRAHRVADAPAVARHAGI